MSTTAEILIIIVSAALTIFLLAAIAVLVLVIKILRKVKHITNAAENVVDSVEAVGEAAKHASGPMTIFRLVYNMVDKAKSKRDKKK